MGVDENVDTSFSRVQSVDNIEKNDMRTQKRHLRLNDSLFLSLVQLLLKNSQETSYIEN